MATPLQWGHFSQLSQSSGDILKFFNGQERMGVLGMKPPENPDQNGHMTMCSLDNSTDRFQGKPRVLFGSLAAPIQAYSANKSKYFILYSKM